MATISEALAIAVQQHQAGLLKAAEQIYRRILQAQPNHADATHLLGLIAHQVGNHEVAVQYIGRAIALEAGAASFHNNLGSAYSALRRIPEAVACYRRALELEPDYAEAHYNLGIALKHQGKLDEAVACYRRALARKPDYAEAHHNLGLALCDQGKLDEGIACYRRALELRPDAADTHNNLGTALKDLGNLDEAVACYRRALELKPDYAEARFSQSLLSLVNGDFERGWVEYEWRWKTRQYPPRDFSQALWDGQPLEGRTILLHAEQGLGDILQFVRYAALVQRQGGTVILECLRPLLPLLQSCAGIDRLVGRGDQLPAFDVHAPLLSLPRIFHTVLENIPATVPYVYADQGLVEHWRQELDGLAGFKIGIAWQGDPGHPMGRDRWIPLRCFEPLARCCGVRLLSLQKRFGLEQLHEVADRFAVVDLGSRLDEGSGAFLDTAAVMRNLDLVVTSDTAVAHLAGALGVRVWIAMPSVPDWRWLLDRSDCPWYPTMRLFRQDRRGDWQGVFQRIEAALGEYRARLPALPSGESRDAGDLR